MNRIRSKGLVLCKTQESNLELSEAVSGLRGSRNANPLGHRGKHGESISIDGIGRPAPPEGAELVVEFGSNGWNSAVSGLRLVFAAPAIAPSS
jgi:hypothetical protein